MVNKDYVTSFERLLQIRADVSYVYAKHTWGLSKALFKSALKADAKRMAANLGISRFKPGRFAVA